MDVDAEIAALTARLAQLQKMKHGEPVFPAECRKKVENRICLNCGKPIAAGERNTRGNHLKCHKQTLRAIEAGHLTDFEAIEAGLFAPPAKSGAKPKAGTRLAEFLAAKNEQEASELDRREREIEAEFEADITAALAKEEARQLTEQAKKPKPGQTKRKAN